MRPAIAVRRQGQDDFGDRCRNKGTFMKISKLSGMTCSILLTLGILTACGSSNEPETPNEPEIPTQPEQPEEPTEPETPEEPEAPEEPETPVNNFGDIDSGVRTIQVDGTSRQFYLHAPNSYNGSSSVPLVLDFHGIFGSGSGQMGSSGYRGVADQEGFIVAYPDGIDQAWNVGPCCTLDRGVDDVAFARAIVEAVSEEANIDASRVYATGFSMGGGMAQYLACHAADVFAAVAPNAFDLLQQNAPQCVPSRPISVLLTRGTNDSVVPYGGGASNPPNGLPTIHFLGATANFQKWSELNGCASVTQNQNGCEIRTQCTDGVEVGLCTQQGGGHSPGDAAAGWNFLKKHTLP